MGTAAVLVVCYCCGIIVTRIFTRMWLGVVGGGWLSGCVVEWLSGWLGGWFVMANKYKYK